MLITQIKEKEAIESLVSGKKVFFLNCRGCAEVHFPEREVLDLEAALAAEEDAATVTGSLTTDYICNPDNLRLRLDRCRAAVEEAVVIVVFSCGVGVQTVANALEDKVVFAGCDTVRLPGFQGVTPLEVDCGQCGECYLNLTGGICPITACSKSLLNGPCGGTKNGMCEVDGTMECGWERIYRRLKEIGRTDLIGCPTQIRNYATDEATSHRG